MALALVVPGASMSYSNFTSFEMIETDLGVTISDQEQLFRSVPAVEYSNFLIQTLKDNLPLALAINTEKSRSELIIAPILVELRKRKCSQISVFSGREFNVDPQKGLTGFCDFLISCSPEQLFIKAPVVVLVEAKNDNIQAGLPQCMAEMVAAQIFNQKKENGISTVYGVVTTGTNWRFLKLESQRIEVDLKEYFLDDLGSIIGILEHSVHTVRPIA